MHAFQQLALSSATLQIHFELNTNATALLGSLLWAVHTLAAAFLRRSSITGFSPNPSVFTHCAYFQQKPDLWRLPFGTKPFGQRGFQELSNKRNWHSFALQTMTLNVLILRWMKLIFLLCVFPCFFCVMFSSEGTSLAATRWKWLTKRKMQSADLSMPILVFDGFTSD